MVSVMTYQVRVMGSWQELRSRTAPDEPHESQFIVTSCFPRGAEIAGVQLFRQQASLDRSAVAECQVTAAMLAAAA